MIGFGHGVDRGVVIHCSHCGVPFRFLSGIILARFGKLVQYLGCYWVVIIRFLVVFWQSHPLLLMNIGAHDTSLFWLTDSVRNHHTTNCSKIKPPSADRKTWLDNSNIICYSNIGEAIKLPISTLKLVKLLLTCEGTMLLGTWYTLLDNSGRFTIPTPLRPLLQPGMIITRGFDRCLQLCPEPFWRGLAQRVNNLTLSGDDERWVRRLLFAEAMVLRLDDQGTITLSEALRGYAGIDRQVVLIGMDQYLEVWNPERWQECQATLVAATGRWSRRDWDMAVSLRDGFSL
jgi:MraZ protein